MFGLAVDTVKDRLSSGQLTVAVYGLGRVGLPLAVSWLMAGAKVIGVSRTKKTVRNVMSMKCRFDEPGIPEALKRFVPKGRLTATTDGVAASKKSEVKLIAVPSTVDLVSRTVDLSSLEDVYPKIGRGLKKGDLVITETSVPPGTTTRVAKPLLEGESGLKVGTDFGLAYSPERIYEGRAVKDIVENYPKVVGADDSFSLDTAAALYECIAQKGVIRLSSSVAAEAEKLFEGVYRDVNIALANELAKFCQAFGVDFWETRRAANSQPFCRLHSPGPGVGGWCIPYYPYFVLSEASKVGINLPLTKLARETNETMPHYIVRLLCKEAVARKLKVGRSKVAILGLAFRGDVADTRLSPTYDLAMELKSLGADIWVYDPWIRARDEGLREKGARQTSSLRTALKNASFVLVATDHTEFRKLSLRQLLRASGRDSILVVDTRNVLDASEVPDEVSYVVLGDGGAPGK